MLIIPSLPVNEQNREIDDVEIGDGSLVTCWKGPGESHDQISPAGMIKRLTQTDK